MMPSECRRLAGQLRKAFTGDPWHGSPLRDILDGITAEQATRSPLPSAHTILELVLHIEIYLAAALGTMHGVPMPRLYGTEIDWPSGENGGAAWSAATSRMFDSAGELAAAIEQFSDERLSDTVPGRHYDFYYLFHGIVQHSLYHGGQIAMLIHAVHH